MQICRSFEGIEKKKGGYLVHTNAPDIFICFLTDEIVRIRASFDKKMEEGSYVLMLTAWEDRLDELFKGERERVQPVEPKIQEEQGRIVFSTSELVLELSKEPFGFRLLNREGTLLYSDLCGNPYTLDANRRVTHYSMMKEDDCFYGFGEKGGELNKNKKFLRERATDAMGYDPTCMDTLYKHIPFYIRLDRESGEAVGIFYHNFYESVFNMGCEKSNYWSRYSYWQADGGDIDLFLLGGRGIPGIVDNYTRLTGRPALLPKRALGYQASSMYYPELEENSDDAVLSFIDTIKAEGFPIDGFHLSSGYTSYENKRCVFHWNRTRFKDPEAYFAACNERGAQNVPNVKPGVLLMHPRFQEFAAQNVFVRDSEQPKTYAVGAWWGGDGAFFDYTNPAARALWKQLLKENIIELGTNSIWDDNCEYDSLLDKDAICDFDGRGGTIAELKPLQATLMCKLAQEAVQECDEEARPYVVCRSGSAGIQHYAQTWCGDNHTDWTTLKYDIPIITGMGLSGQPNEGADIGGFAGPAPEEELFVRWVQQGIFQARFSIHSASSDNTVTEPWMYSNSAGLIREAILFRYRMLPYLYSALYEASVSGAPLMRALVYEFQKDPQVYDRSFEFMFGRDILVANVLEPGAETRTLYLPAGTRWYDWNHHYRCYEGGQELTVPVDITSIPMFLREGAIIPMAKNQLYSMEKEQVRQLHLLLVPGADSSYTLYEDDGVSMRYRKGVYRKTKITMSGTTVVNTRFVSEGSYPDSIESVLVEMVRKDKSPFFVELCGERLPHYLNRRQFMAAERGWYYSQTDRAVLIQYPNPRQDYTLKVSFEAFDLIGM